MEDQGGMGRTAATKRPAARGRWTAQQRQQIVDASLVTGASIQEVAKQHGVRANLLTAWRRRHAAAIATSKGTISAARFSAVRVTAVPADGVTGAGIGVLAWRCF